MVKRTAHVETQAVEEEGGMRAKSIKLLRKKGALSPNGQIAAMSEQEAWGWVCSDSSSGDEGAIQYIKYVSHRLKIRERELREIAESWLEVKASSQRSGDSCHGENAGRVR